MQSSISVHQIQKTYRKTSARKKQELVLSREEKLEHKTNHNIDGSSSVFNQKGTVLQNRKDIKNKNGDKEKRRESRQLKQVKPENKKLHLKQNKNPGS